MMDRGRQVIDWTRSDLFFG